MTERSEGASGGVGVKRSICERAERGSGRGYGSEKGRQNEKCSDKEALFAGAASPKIISELASEASEREKKIGFETLQRSKMVKQR